MNKLLTTMSQPTPVRKGFVRVLITSRNKTIQIRESHARNQAYLTKHGMTIVPAPIAPPVPVAPPLPPEIPQPAPTKPKSQPNGK